MSASPVCGTWLSRGAIISFCDTFDSCQTFSVATDPSSSYAKRPAVVDSPDDADTVSKMTNPFKRNLTKQKSLKSIPTNLLSPSPQVVPKWQSSSKRLKTHPNSEREYKWCFLKNISTPALILVVQLIQRDFRMVGNPWLGRNAEG